MATPRKKKSKGSKTPRIQASKSLLLPLPRRTADTMSLQCRLALENVRCQRATRADAICMAQVLLLTVYLAEDGFCRLDLSSLRELERDLLALLDQGSSTDEWNFAHHLIEPMTRVVNEHDRHLREVRLSAMLAAKDRLERVVAAAPRTLAAVTGEQGP